MDCGFGKGFEELIYVIVLTILGTNNKSLIIELFLFFVIHYCLWLINLIFFSWIVKSETEVTITDLLFFIYFQ